MSVWNEVDSTVTDPTQSDYPFGPTTLATSLKAQVITALDNLSTLHPHYGLIPTYINMAKDEIMTLGLAMGKQFLDQVPRLRNWRWWGITLSGQNFLPLPERMLYLEAMSYSKSTAAYDPSTTVLYPSNPIPPSAAQEFGIYPRTAVGWPILFHRAGGRIEMWPVPQSTPTDYRTAIVVYGTRMDKDLVNDGDALLMSPRLQLLVVDLAVAISMEKMGWDEGPERRSALMTKLATLVGPATKERAAAKLVTRVAGTPV